MVLVVCDSTPLIYLARLCRFELLRQLHETVLIPPAVWDEIAVIGSGYPEGQALKAAVNAGWVRVEKPRGTLSSGSSEVQELDPGEAEAIQLAIEHHALLAIDEAHGRHVAMSLGVRITGTVGLLLRARKENLIPSLRAELDRLRSETTFRLSQAVYDEVLRVAGEVN